MPDIEYDNAQSSHIRESTDTVEAIYVKRIYFGFIAAYALVAAYISIKYLFVRGNILMALLGPVSLIFLTVPYICETLFKIKLGYLLKSTSVLFCLLAFQVGVSLRWFDSFYNYDKLMHGLSGILFTTMGFCIYARMNGSLGEKREKLLLQMVFAVSFSMLIAVGWEIGEYLTFLTVGHDAQHHLTTGVVDTMQDLISCVIGSLVLAVDFWFCYGRNKKMPLSAPLVEFDRVNASEQRD